MARPRSGEFRKTSGGYIGVPHPENARWTMRQHVEVAMMALGKQLPPGAEVHHVDGDKANNENSNLVICESKAYHAMLHMRARALDACGHADWLKCRFCKQYDNPDWLRLYTYQHKSCKAPTLMPSHRECELNYARGRREQRR